MADLNLIVPENPALEGVISFLASRPHSWKSWQVSSLRIFNQDKLQSMELFLEVERDDPSLNQPLSFIHFRGLEASPSEIVQQSLTSQSLPGTSPGKRPSWLKSGLQSPWKKSAAAESLKTADIGEWAVIDHRAFQTEAMQRIFIKNQ